MFRHYLVFTDFEVEVLEPIGFDASNFVVDQGENYARDTYTFNDKIDFVFYNEKGDELEETRLLNNGVILTHQESGLRFLIEEFKRNGSEAVVKYKLTLDNLDFSLSQLDFADCETDFVSYFKCKLIQESEKANIKKREAIKIDAFATKDLDDKTISPIPTQKILLKSLPVFGESKWTSPSGFFNARFTAEAVLGNSSYHYYNPCKESVKYEIEDSLSFLDSISVSLGAEDYTKQANFAVLQAVEQLTDVKIEITDFLFLQNTDVDNGGNGYVTNSFRIVWGYSPLFPIGFYEPYNVTINEYQTFTYNQPINYTIPVVPKGAYVWIYGKSHLVQSASGPVNPIFEAFTTLSAFNTKITANSTSVDVVIEASRYIDLIKQNYKGIGCEFTVNAPLYDVGGKHYNNFCYTGNLILQRKDKPFYIELKQTIESLLELNADAQINDNKIFIGHQKDFYTNIDMGGFLIAPDKNFKYTNNEKYLINEFSIGYEHYEDERGEEGTLDSIHTTTQWYIPNNNSMNKKEIKTPFTRDAKRIEGVKRRNTRITDDANETDDEIFISDVLPLSPSTRGEFLAYLKYTSNGTQVRILSDNSFSWNLLGFKVGDTIKINGANVVVASLTDRNIVVNWASAVLTGQMVFKINYPYTDVQYVTRNGEGLIYSENLPNATKYGNLRYSIKRNIKEWYTYLSTAGKFIVEKSIKNTYFKNNGNAITQFSDEPNRIKENEEIKIVDITNEKIINQNIITTTVTATFKDVKDLIPKVQNQRGFIRVQNQQGAIVKGYIKKLDHNWKYNELKLILEEKNESDFLDITFVAGTLTINEVGYPTKIVTEKMYNIFNGFIQFFDENNINLCNRTYYDKVKYNGVVYDSIDELIIAIGS